MQLSGLNATDKTPMYEMPLTFLASGGFGVGKSTFCIEVLSVVILSLEFCPKTHIVGSNIAKYIMLITKYYMYMYVYIYYITSVLILQVYSEVLHAV